MILRLKSGTFVVRITERATAGQCAPSCVELPGITCHLFGGVQADMVYEPGNPVVAL